jgi:hypothetical protein
MGLQSTKIDEKRPLLGRSGSVLIQMGAGAAPNQVHA